MARHSRCALTLVLLVAVLLPQLTTVDSATGTATLQLDHFSAFQLGDNLSGSSVEQRKLPPCYHWLQDFTPHPLKPIGLSVCDAEHAILRLASGDSAAAPPVAPRNPWRQGARMRPATALLKLALRRAARGTGSSAAFLDRRTAMIPTPDISAILGPIPWVLVGGLALRAYAPERMTLDIDIMIYDADEGAAKLAFANAGYRLTGPLTIGGFTAHPADSGAPIDVLTSAEPWFTDAVAHPTPDPAGLPAIPRPYLLLLKLQAGRTQDLADVQRLLRGTSAEERSAMRAIVSQYAADLAEDYDALVLLADLEYGAAR